MDIDALASLESQKQFCNELVDLVVKKESFIILAGARGSGRTVMCEQVVNETDSKMRAVFIPCHKDMPLQRLRELFLQQLLPNTEFNTDLNLPDALLKTYIPHKDKILVVVDDADMVVSSFFNELLALYEQVLGQSRFSFILVGQPLWAEEKISRAASTSKVVITLKEIPALNIQESLVLSRHIFAVNNAMVIYKALSKQLPELLAGANGNLSRVIAITEKLMKEPTAPQSSQDTGRKNKLQKTKSKSSSVGIFVTVVCIIIVLACLIPIFFGGNFFSPDDKDPTKAQVANENSLLLNDGSLSFNDSLSTDEGLLLPNANNGIDAESSSRQTEHSVTLSGKDLEKIEGGANGSGYPRGVDGSVANQGDQGEQLITLHREDNINHRRAQEPGQEMTSFDVSATQQQALQAQQQAAQQQAAQQQAAQTAAAAAAQSAAAQSAAAEADQAAKLAEARAAENAKAAKAAEERQRQQQQAAAAKARELEKAAQEKLAADRARAEAARQQQQAANQQEPRQEPQQTAANTRPSLRAGQVISLADEQRAQRGMQNPLPPPRVANNPPARSGGRAVEGNINEVRSIPNSHFTVQIVSSSSRSNVTNAARGLTGRYWVLETRYNNRPWYVLISGDYPTREAAAAAARQIPSSVSQGATPFAKRIMDIKPEIR